MKKYHFHASDRMGFVVDLDVRAFSLRHACRKINRICRKALPAFYEVNGIDEFYYYEVSEK